jgi:hypothetical protein
MDTQVGSMPTMQFGLMMLPMIGWLVMLVVEEETLGLCTLMIRVPHVLLILQQIGIFFMAVNGILWLAHHSLAHKQKVRRPY